jgi:hypothetical protein
MDFDVQQEITSLPGNGQCCDCPASNPEWASVSLGTLICLECAGLHRGLGVQVRGRTDNIGEGCIDCIEPRPSQVSFVRSLTMDDWDETQINAMLVRTTLRTTLDIPTSVSSLFSPATVVECSHQLALHTLSAFTSPECARFISHFNSPFLTALSPPHLS